MSEIKTILVHEADGRIVKTVSGHELQIQQQEEVVNGNVPLIIVDDLLPPSVANTHYVWGGGLAPRPAMSLRVSGLHVEGLPAGAIITIDGEQYQCNDTVAELSFSYPGRYKVGVSCWPYQDVSLEVVAP